ncbi:MAG: bifunctional hydroxymethylpyrimidine kinase/phosphomethylpyrimidine kinase [Proteobacteria bacterium]|nr:bifunctional hydroxymethylpyrimidine kinase/phosphomethylpyrimidine kinase [Pseudomonadota bacterium]NOG61734.1 bifunctional hydroxymethylpyrimidine kinase/phosphomethylpyrimidine kinase [Pseudomonadota bacterium]
MINSNNQKPVVLVIAGHDPSGGAGIQADIETIASAGCHATSVITSLTAQNTKQVVDILPQKPAAFRKQIGLILEDMQIASCKIGMIGDVQLVDIIQNELSNIIFPVVLDPVMGSTSGQSFADDNICKKILSSLLPITTVLTPNTKEARILSQSTNINEAADKFLKLGASSVLITGADEETDVVTNTFFTETESPVEYHWERLTGSFHGSGCTLSSRIAALLALDNDIKTSVEIAQAYTWNTLKHGIKIGQGQVQPDRFYEE